ncbi:codeine O-demethylase-like [Capsicum galapagoense]
MFYITTLPPHIRQMDLFQRLPSKLREIMEAYCKEMKNLAMIILCQLAKALRMDEMEMRELFSDGVQSMRMNYYPPCPEPHKTIGFSPHSDADALTILFQLNETEGLQFRKDGIWVPIKPLPNALIVNIGDIMEIVSNGVYKSIEHRAIVNSNEERLSVATFYSSNLDSELGPAHSLTGPNNPPIFRRVPVDKYFKDFFARKLDGKSYIDFMKEEARDGKS